MLKNLRDLRAYAINNTLFKPTTLGSAFDQLGFVQADPIKSPATAQDLILRQRVKNYRVGDLEKKYAALKLEEDFLYAYGFMPSKTWQLLHPRAGDELSALEQSVLKHVTKVGSSHPRDLEEHFGSEREVNAWGGYSKATTRALERLHRRGLLRVAGREKGIRIYASTAGLNELHSVEVRCEKLVLMLVNIFAPIPLRAMQSLKFSKPESCNTKAVVAALLKSGVLSSSTVDGVVYLTVGDSKTTLNDAPEMVRILAPFDPLVWDRARFEAFWGWGYRFEAYTPIAKRVRGYYAMPILWRDDVIGWANVSTADGAVNVDAGYVGKAPRSAAFRAGLADEIDRLRYFLRV